MSINPPGKMSSQSASRTFTSFREAACCRRTIVFPRLKTGSGQAPSSQARPSLLVITAAQDAFWGICLGREDDYPRQANVRWRWRKSGEGSKEVHRHTPSRLLSLLFNGKSRRELGNIFLLLCWLQKAKKESATCDSSPACKTFCYFSSEPVVSRLPAWPHSDAAAKEDQTF